MNSKRIWRQSAIAALLGLGCASFAFAASDADLAALNSGSSCASCDLSGADLYMRVLAGADLSGANLSGANLSKAVLSGANLAGANVSGAELGGAITDGGTTCPSGVAGPCDFGTGE